MILSLTTIHCHLCHPGRASAYLFIRPQPARHPDVCGPSSHSWDPQRPRPCLADDSLHFAQRERADLMITNGQAKLGVAVLDGSKGLLCDTSALKALGEQHTPVHGTSYLSPNRYVGHGHANSRRRCGSAGPCSLSGSFSSPKRACERALPQRPACLAVACVAAPPMSGHIRLVLLSRRRGTQSSAGYPCNLNCVAGLCPCCVPQSRRQSRRPGTASSRGAGP